MLFTSVASLAICIGSAVSLALPQDFDFDAIAEIPPAPTPVVAVGAASQVVSYNVASMIAAATGAPLVTATHDDSSTADKKMKRQAVACTSLPTGSGPVPTPDTAAAFASYAPFAAAANNALTPAGYTNTFKNINASVVSYGYLGSVPLNTYDVAGCAARCTSTYDCHGFNIYFERAPTLEPSNSTTDSVSCQNPSSSTFIRCVIWGGPVDGNNALTYGQKRGQFQAVIAGSNGYTNYAATAPSGYTAPTLLNNSAINAPLDCNGAYTYMGFKLFNDAAPFDIQRCAAACTQQSQYNLAHPPTTGAAQTCQFFVTYILEKNGSPQGQYCSLYNETWSATYATNNGQYDRAGNHFTIAYSYSSSNATDPGTCVVPAPPTVNYMPCSNPGGCASNPSTECGGGCFCDAMDNGKGFCNNANAACTAYQPCSVTTDCQSGYVCNVSTCCPGGICIAMLQPACANGALPSLLFVSRVAGETMVRKPSTYKGQ